MALQMLDRTYATLEDAIKDRVCKYCVDRQPDGPPCQIEGSLCCVFGHLDEVEKVVSSDEGKADMQPFILGLRRQVCAHCEHMGEDGCCDLRAETLCPLNNYFPMVVEAIESYHHGHKFTCA